MVFQQLELSKQEAKRYGVAVTGSELVGPVRLEYLLNSLEYYLGLQGFRRDQILETHLIE